MFNILYDVACSNGSTVLVVDSIVPNFVSTVVNVIKIAIPILLIVFGLIYLGKATIAQKDDEIKKAQTTFVKRIIAAVLVFFVVAIVQLVFGLVDNAGKNPNSTQTGTTDTTQYETCINCFINGSCTATTTNTTTGN